MPLLRRLLAVVITAGLGCRVSPPPATPPPESTPPPLTGTALMRAELRAIADRAPEENIYLETRNLRALEQAEARLGAEATALDRYKAALALGQSQLEHLSDPLPAVESFRRAHAAAVEMGDLLPVDQRVDMTMKLAIAELRLGETQNCVAHHTSESCLLPIVGGGRHVVPEPSRRAIARFEEALALATAPAQLAHRIRGQWLLNVAYMTVGGHPESVPPAYLIPPDRFRSAEPFPRFPEVAGRLHLDSFDLAGSAVLDDLDNDGFIDVFTTTMDLQREHSFFHNDGDGRFTNRTADAGISGLLGGLNNSQADYDNDGNVDLLVLRGAWFRDSGRHPDSLIRNRGDGTFEDVTFAAGLALPYQPGHAGVWADYDLDGDVDLYVTGEYSVSEPFPSQLFENRGDGTFREVTTAAGVANLRFAKGAAWGDFDADGDPDLYVSNLLEPNRLYRNQGDGRFVDVAEELGVSAPVHSFATWFWDYDNDGNLDLYVAGYQRELALLVAHFVGEKSPADTMRLYRGDGRGGFEDVTRRVGLELTTATMGANLGDLDNDGFLDFYLGTGAPDPEAVVPNLMYRNRGGRDFVDVTSAGGFGHLQKGHGIAFADLDNDGDQDIYASMGGMYAFDAFQDAVFLNPGFGSRWLTVRLIGTNANRSAIGARIRVTIDDPGGQREVYSWVSSGGSFGANSLQAEIGLGTASRIVELEVRWPGSGAVELLRDVPLDSFISIREGDARFRIEARPRVSFEGGTSP